MLRRDFLPFLFLLSAALVVCAGVVFFVSVFREDVWRGRGRFLEIRDADSGRLYIALPLEEGDSFSIEFIHSVNNSAVKESFVVNEGMIRPVASRFYSFGAGMQSDLEEGQTLSRDGDAMVITGFTSAFRELNYIVGTVSDHLLCINGEIVSLRGLCGRNAHITIKSVVY